MSVSLSYGGNWYLHPTQMSANESDRVVSVKNGTDRGWERKKVDTSYHLVRLWRDPANTAEKGIFIFRQT